MDIPWGEVMQLRRAQVNLPGNGGPGSLGIFRVIDYSQPSNDRRFISSGGDGYIAAIEFSNPIQARVLTTYGNASQPSSPHQGDQLKLSARKELRPAWRSRSEIETHLESRQVF
jgi:acyl-homoserine-lactone acylase